jgi:F0F1-type ATP synthase membrane subunit a
MIILLGSLSIGVPAIWMGMGILVGIVQAIVFMALITVYYSLLVMTHKEEDKH